MPRLCLLLGLALVFGCQSGSTPTQPEGPSVPTDDPTAVDDRDLAGLLGGTVTLNGTLATDPSYKNAPYRATYNGRAGDIALVTFKAETLPYGNNVVAAKVDGATTPYAGRWVSADGSSYNLPVYLTKTEPLYVTLHNGTTGNVYPQAVRWNYRLRTLPALDAAEPNDDANPASTGDRYQASPLPLDRAASFSLFKSATASDLEDWHRLDLSGGTQYHLTLATNNGVWGTWRFDATLYNGAGQSVASSLGIAGPTGVLSFRAPEVGTEPYYLQVVGTPVTRKGGSVFYAPYSVKAQGYAAPDFTTSLIGNPGTFAANDSRASMVMLNGRPAVAYFRPESSSRNRLEVARALTSTPVDSSDWSITLIDPDTALGGTVSMVVKDGRLALNYDNGGGAYGELNYARATVPEPTSASDWNSYLVTSGGGEACSLGVVNNTFVQAFNFGGLCVARATTSEPGPGEWLMNDFFEDPVEMSSITELNGQTVIVYAQSAGTYQSISAKRTNGTGWVETVVVSEAGLGSSVDVASAGGQILISYVERNPFAVNVLTSTTPNFTSANDFRLYTLTDTGLAGGGTVALATVGGRPVLGFASDNAPGLTLARGTTELPAGPTDWMLLPLNPAMEINGLAMEELNGRLQVSYGDAATGTQYFAAAQGAW
ncbi:MAG TPA: hypothetical protein VEI97_01395 [bacterium]|nr:hypothetical protein [bacterium]